VGEILHCIALPHDPARVICKGIWTNEADEIGIFYLKCSEKVNGFFKKAKGMVFPGGKCPLSRYRFLDYTQGYISDHHQPAP
jgi:hypothetical protein